MTIASETSRANYTGNGVTTVFPYPFKILDATHLRVTQRDAETATETTLAYGSDYSVSGVGQAAGGNVTLDTALPVGDTLAIRRVVPLTQPTALQNQQQFFPGTIEGALDRLLMQLHQQQDALGRSMVLPETVDPDDVSVALPLPAANRALFWNAGATALETRALDDSDNVALPGEGRTVETLTAFLANATRYRVEDYDDPGILDKAVVFNAAITAAAADGTGGVVEFRGRWAISSTITMRRSVVLIGVPGSANFYTDTDGAQITVADKTITAFAFGVNAGIPAIGAGLYGFQLVGPAANVIGDLDGTYTGVGVQIGTLPADQPDDGMFVDHVAIMGFGTGILCHRPNNFIRHCDLSTCNTLIHFEGTDPITDAYGVRGNEVEGCNLHAAGERFVTIKNGAEVNLDGGTYGSSDSALGLVLENAWRVVVDGVRFRLCNGGATITVDNSHHCDFTGVHNYGYVGFNPGLTKTHGYHFLNGSSYHRITGGTVLRHRQHGILIDGNCPFITLNGVGVIDNGLHAYTNDTPEAAPSAGNGYDGIRGASANIGSLKVIGCTFANTTTYDGVLPQRYAMRSPGGVVFNRLICVGNHADNMGEGTTTGFIGDSPQIDSSPNFWTFSAPPAAGSWTTGDVVLNADRGGVGRPWGWRCIGSGSPGTWAADNIQPGVSADRGDADFTWQPGDAPTQRMATILTANRTVTLGTTNAVQGYRVRVVRTGLGAFTVDVGGLKTIPSGTAAYVDAEYTGAAWVLTGYGTL